MLAAASGTTATVRGFVKAVVGDLRIGDEASPGIGVESVIEVIKKRG